MSSICLYPLPFFLIISRIKWIIKKLKFNIKEKNYSSYRTILLNKYLTYNEELKDIYHFGVWSGDSIIEIENIFEKKQIPYRIAFGFDSFIGLPENFDDIKEKRWKKGSYSSQKLFKTNSPEETIKLLNNLFKKNFIGSSNNTQLISGFFNDSLKNKNIKNKYKPAIYVDIDVDLYSSAIEVLEFLFSNKIIKKGTLINYDDWGGTKGWEKHLSGESLAHKQICKKYNLEFELLEQIGKFYPNVSRLYLCIKSN